MSDLSPEGKFRKQFKNMVSTFSDEVSPREMLKILDAERERVIDIMIKKSLEGKEEAER